MWWTFFKQIFLLSPSKFVIWSNILIEFTNICTILLKIQLYLPKKRIIFMCLKTREHFIYNFSYGIPFFFLNYWKFVVRLVESLKWTTIADIYENNRLLFILFKKGCCILDNFMNLLNSKKIFNKLLISNHCHNSWYILLLKIIDVCMRIKNWREWWARTI